MARPGVRSNSRNERGVYQRSGVWCLDAHFKGVRIREAVGPDRRQAEDLLQLRKTQIIEQKYFPARAGRSLTAGDVLSTYWGEHLQHATAAYREIVKIRLDHVADFFGGHRVESLTQADVDDYARSRRICRSKMNRPISETTIRDELLVLTSALKWCHLSSRACRIQANPLAGCKLPERPTPKKILLDEGVAGDQWEALLENVHPDTRDVVLALYESAMRPKEIFLMSWSWIERVSADCWLVKVPQDVEKTGADRRIPVSPRWLESLRRLESAGPTTGIIYPSPQTGERRYTLRRAFKTAMRNAKLENRGLTPYALRRTRLSIWDAVDSAAAKHAAGHVETESHFRNYVAFPAQRLMRLVGVDMSVASQLRVAKAA